MSRWFTIMNTSFALDTVVRIVLDASRGTGPHRLHVTFRADPPLVFEMGAPDAKTAQAALLHALAEWEERAHKPS